MTTIGLLAVSSTMILLVQIVAQEFSLEEKPL